MQRGDKQRPHTAGGPRARELTARRLPGRTGAHALQPRICVLQRLFRVLLSSASAESDFREAIQLLKPLAGSHPSRAFARARAGLQQPASLLAWTICGLAEAKEFYEAAICRTRS